VQPSGLQVQESHANHGEEMSERNDHEGLVTEALDITGKAFVWVITFPVGLIFRLFSKDQKKENERQSNKD
jgi:hypothetical protein